MKNASRFIPSRRVFGVTCVVEALLLLGLLVLLSQALRPDFGGGKFVVVTLFISIGFLVIAMVRDVIAAILADRHPTAGAADAHAVRHEWGVMLRGLALVLVLFGLIFLFGTVVGMTVVALVMLRWYIGVGYGPAVAGAAVLGVLIPTAFAWAIGMTLWPGMISEIVPGWLGGGVLPPL